ncbi:hypothetical protein FACS189411_08290 [Bacteroidia bacterium]|nr:hypothetical protein FACS189411_08290 [Bacteroidia bacterium]
MELYRPFIPNDPDLIRFYRIDSVNFIIGIYENGVSSEMNDQVYTYQFFEDKLKLDWVQGIRDHGGWFHPKIFIYKRIK